MDAEEQLIADCERYKKALHEIDGLCADLEIDDLQRLVMPDGFAIIAAETHMML